MARDGSGNYTLPANTQAVSGDPISSTKFNTLVQDLEADANTDRPIVAGGTGASTASAARTNLGLEIGTDVQAFDAGLLSIAGLTTAADESIYTTASDTYAVYTLTAAGRAILDDADASAQRTTLGLGTIATQAANSVSITGGSITGITDLAIVDGGTGASDAGAARTNLGLAIGTDVQAYDAGLQSIAGLTTVADRMIYTTASDTYAVTTLTTFGRSLVDDADASAARTTLGLANGATTTISAFALTMLDDADAAATRTTLGLGTAALKNTGTSGDAVPLLNAANTFSETQTVSNGSGLAKMQSNGDIVAYRAGGTTGAIYLTDDASRYLYYDGTNYLFNGAELGINGGTAWHSLNDGAGSGLDADTVDGAHVGTSGATIPLLNAANTFSAVQGLSNNIALNILETDGTARSAVKMNASNVMEFGNANNNASFLNNTVNFAGAGDFTRSGNTIWHAGNDGAGSGLDADTLDGVEGSAFATLAGTQTFTALNIFSAGAEATNAARITNAATSRRLHLYSGKVGSQNGDLTLDAEDGNTVNIQTSGSNRATFNATQATFSVPAQIRTAASTETTGTLTSSSSNKTIQATGDITIDNSVFAAGDIILIYAGASSRTITEGSGVTMRLGGTATTGSRTLAARGVAMLFFVSSSEVVVSGGAVT